ncbi:5580_t:CDS:2 [Entrophospora sp. SA101]|nr:5580_t:CDS:2 [Entrophospora sp. SA101]
MPLTKNFILSDEIYSSDSDVDIIHIEVAIKQGKRNNPENKIGIPRTTKYRKYGPSDEFAVKKYSSHRRVPDSVYTTLLKQGQTERSVT